LNPSAPAPPPHGLRLDLALQLLQQSGRDALPGAPGSAEWLQHLIDALVELSSRDALTGLPNRAPSNWRSRARSIVWPARANRPCC
jgi:hypothetical protein